MATVPTPRHIQAVTDTSAVQAAIGLAPHIVTAEEYGLPDSVAGISATPRTMTERHRRRRHDRARDDEDLLRLRLTLVLSQYRAY
jgi:hypothetical protein